MVRHLSLSLQMLPKIIPPILFVWALFLCECSEDTCTLLRLLHLTFIAESTANFKCLHRQLTHMCEYNSIIHLFGRVVCHMP